MQNQLMASPRWCNAKAEKTFKLWEEREREQDKDRDNSLNSIAVFARDRLARQILASVILG